MHTWGDKGRYEGIDMDTTHKETLNEGDDRLTCIWREVVWRPMEWSIEEVEDEHASCVDRRDQIPA